MKIELKNIRYAAFASEETACYSAGLYIDGRKIGTVGNDGHGSCDRFHGDQAAYRGADAWCRANLPKIAFGDRPPLDADIETHCAALLDGWLCARDLKRDMKTKILMRDRVLTLRTGPGRVRIFGHIPDRRGVPRCRRRSSPTSRSRLR